MALSIFTRFFGGGQDRPRSLLEEVHGAWVGTLVKEALEASPVDLERERSRPFLLAFDLVAG